MDIQFVHLRHHGPKGGSTVAVGVPDKGTLTAMLLPDTKKQIDLLVGYSRCHPTDLFNKKTGRDKAIEKMLLRTYDLDEVRYLTKNSSTVLELHMSPALDPTKEEDIRKIVLEIKPRRFRVWLTKARLNPIVRSYDKIDSRYE